MRDDPHLILWRDEDVLRGAQVAPLPEKLAARIENLDAVVLAIAHVHRAFGIDGNGVRDLELTRAFARRTPRGQVFAVARKLHHARIAVSIGNIEITVL